MKILIADKFQEQYLSQLEALGNEVTLNPNLTADDLPTAIAGYNCLIVRSTKVTSATIDASDKLGLIIRAGAGVNTIDISQAAQRGIFVCNCPGKNAVAVAELAFGLLAAIDRKIPDNVIELKQGKWNKKTFAKADGLMGKTVAVLGLGEIGINFAIRARAFGMQVIALQKNRAPQKQQRLDKIGITFLPTIKDVLSAADVVSIHVPSNAETQGMVNSEFLAAMKDNAILLNTSRGNIIDDQALLKAIETKNLRVGLDVYNDEPGSSQGDFTNPLIQHPNVYGTHHIGASTEQAQNAIAAEVVEILSNFQRGVILHAVNVQEHPSATCTLTVRHYDRVGVLASVLTVLKEEQINVEQMENTIFATGKAACATLYTNKEPDAQALKKIMALDDIIRATVKITDK